MHAIFATCPHDQAENLAEVLVSEQLVACVNIIKSVTSIYRWAGKLVKDTESFLIMKTSASKLNDLKARFHELHPYELPAYVVLDINRSQSSIPFTTWITEMTAGLDQAP